MRWYGWTGAGLGLVAGSSLLGLLFVALFSGGIAVYAEVWGTSPAASILFVTGTLAAGALGYYLTLRGDVLMGAGAAFCVSWFTYFAAFMTLAFTYPKGGMLHPDVAGQSFLGAPEIGILGVAFSTALPTWLAWRMRKSSASPSPVPPTASG